ncbi:GntR family transcriptional regulator [Lacticaseibacillus songhuajiangensis]|jgi:GntR family transcriptional regulator|uniref:GntR family transcriptional regulator n=1 Tax=Lacticaseibacillus songhuajiangensis TaxID=1296539 RepID=UPI000F79139F|nr:GntR family transcriptional regulator [Lacticaseibacillus songhuajiangensis]
MDWQQGSKRAYYERLVLKIKREITQQILQADEKLPSVRDMALQEQLNPNTVAKAYKQLEADGVVYVRPGQGTFVAPVVDGSAEQLAQLRARMTELAIEARTQGVSAATMHQWVDEEYGEVSE